MLWAPEQQDRSRAQPAGPPVPAPDAGHARLHGQRFFVRLDGRWHAHAAAGGAAVPRGDRHDLRRRLGAGDLRASPREPLIVFTSNVFAILGLRAMYFLLAGAVERFHLLKYALAVILIFVGLKMVWLNDAFGGKFPIEWSLGIIAALLTGAIVVSWLKRPAPAAAITTTAQDEASDGVHNHRMNFGRCPRVIVSAPPWTTLAPCVRAVVRGGSLGSTLRPSQQIVSAWERAIQPWA